MFKKRLRGNLMTIIELQKKRDELLKNVKKEKSIEYQEGYIDGVLDIYNAAIKIQKKEGIYEV